MGSIGDYLTLVESKRNFICRLVFSCIFLLLCYEFFSHALLYQLRSPALVYPYVDITYLLFNLSGLQQAVSGSLTVSVLFSILLFVFCAAVIICPSKRIYIGLFSLFYFFYFLSYSNFGAHHVHSKIGILFITIPFAVSSKNFVLLWEGLRYFTFFIYADAFIWKLVRGSWLFDKQGILIIKSNITPILYAHPDFRLKGLYEYLFLHPHYADILFKSGFVLEGLFLVGFFTKKFDLYFVFFSLLLAIGFYLMADAFAFELLILNFTLIYNFRELKMEHALK
jgi:hypothetical protein